MFRIAAAVLAISGTPALATPKASIDNATKLCAIFESSGLLSSKCEVSAWNTTVSISIDTTAAEARKICAGVPPLAQRYSLAFDAGWTVQIFSPYSGKNTIAFCSLS